jgi:hypothetical protein
LAAPSVLKAKEIHRRGVQPESLIVYSGTLQFDSITLTEFDPEPGRSTERQYSHKPVRGFDSFTET